VSFDSKRVTICLRRKNVEVTNFSTLGGRIYTDCLQHFIVSRARNNKPKEFTRSNQALDNTRLVLLREIHVVE
jgi:hypothetical protein